MRKMSVEEFGALGIKDCLYAEGAQEDIDNFHDHVHEFYAGQEQEIRRDAYSKGFDRREVIIACTGRVLMFIGVAAFIVAIILAIATWKENDDNQLQAYMASCESGSAVGCLEGVQDQETQAERPAVATAGNVAFFKNRAARYRIAFRLKTSHDLTER